MICARTVGGTTTIIEISDEVWELWTRSWALLGIKKHEKLVKMLEDQMREESINVLEDGETQLLDDVPEAVDQRQKGIFKHKNCDYQKKPLRSGQFCERQCGKSEVREHKA